MTKEKYSLKFVNKGKAFVMPAWSVKKHRAALNEMTKNCKGMSEEERGEEFNYYVIHQTLKQVDPEVTIDDIKELHPEDLIALFNAVYNAGKEGIFYQAPQRKKGGTTGKSTGKKN